MSNRRSTRLASKNKQLGADLVFEENGGHQFNLKAEPSSSNQTRSNNKRKREIVNHPDVEIGRTSEKKSEISPVNDQKPKILARNQNEAHSQGLKDRNNENETQDQMLDDEEEEVLFGSESFLEAVDQLEADNTDETRGNEQKTGSDNRKHPDSLSKTDNLAICSQDMFPDDDAEFLEALSETTENAIQSCVTSKPDQGSLVPSKVLAELGTGLFENGISTAKNVYETSENAKDYNEMQKLQSTKRTFSESGEPDPADKKKKKKTGGSKKKKKKGKFALAFTNRNNVKQLANSAGNELSIEDLSYMTHEEKLQLSSWGLPNQVLNNYRSKGITKLFQWQLDCLADEKVLEGRNLLYSAPTSAGKTLVSEILMLKRVVELGRKAIMILPFVSVAREKVYNLQAIFGDAGIRVEGFMGSVNPPGGFKAVDIAICTIEKANSLINKLLEEGSLADLGTLVVDELHLIGDPHRGYLLELLLTKILYMTSIKNSNEENASLNMTEETTSSWKPKRYHIQIIGMSATLPNLETLAKWLNATLHITDFRPVPLKERLKLEDKLLDEELVPVRDVMTKNIPIQIENDVDNIVYLTLETVLNGFSILIFCPTKALVETTAAKIRGNFLRIGHPNNSMYPAEVGNRLRDNLDGNRLKGVLDQLEQCHGGVDKILAEAVMMGVGYHHAGLTYENRDIVESAFKRGILKVIVATSTLSAGVNLPARRVMIVTPLFNQAILDNLTYRQMCGRAGRNGIDTEGESILICPSTLKDKGISLFTGSMNAVRSALLGDGSLTSSMKRALLEAIASGIASLVTDVRLYAKCTFLFHSLETGLYKTGELSSSQLHKDSTIEECVKYLETQDFIKVKHFEQDDKPDEYVPTQLGSACLVSSLSPDDGIIVYKELLKARECFVLENELHVIYQVTPIYVSDTLRNISWHEYLKIYDGLDYSEKKVAQLVGVSESFIMKAMIGTVSWNNEAQRPTMAIHQRFFAALALSDLVNENSLENVSEKYRLNKGTLQNLQQTASTFAGMVTAFCGRLGWSNLELLLSQFQERLEFGVQRELCDLVKLNCLNGQRARILYDSGIKNIMELAATDPAHVEHILHKASPFKSDIHGGKDSNIWMIGKETLSEAEAALRIVAEARKFIQIELGQQGNVQFAFGQTEIPTRLPKESQKSDTSRENKVVSFTEHTYEKGSNIDSVINASMKSEKILKNEVDSNIENKKLNSSKQSTKDIDMEEYFTQCHIELEQSGFEHNPINVEVNHADGDNDMFEDSFPEIVNTSISALYEKPNQTTTPARPSNTSFNVSIAERVKNSKKQGRNHSSVSVNIEESELEPGLKCSTPLLPTKNKTRFTLKSDECTSPVHSVESPIRFPKVENSTVGTEVQNCGNNNTNFPIKIVEGTSGVFEDSLAEVFDSSFNFSNVSKEYARTRMVKNTSLKLSESDAAALKAIAEDDSKFESEELFPIVENDERNVEPMEVDQKSPHRQLDSNKEICADWEENIKDDIDLNDFDEEDFISTQASSAASPEVNRNEQVEDEIEMFHESSSDTEQESTSCTDSSTSIYSTQEPNILFQEAKIGNLKLTSKTIQSVNLIPDEFFSNCDFIGIGLKLESHQIKSSGVIARHGIGARVLGKKPSNTSILGSEAQQLQHSISLYNGRNTIWSLRWDPDYGLNVAGRKGCGTKRLESLLFRLEAYNNSVAMFDCKEKLKELLKHCGSYILGKFPKAGKILDPKVAQWMWDYDDDDFNITKKKLIDKYVQNEQISRLGWKKDVMDAYFVWKVMTELKKKLDINGLWDHYIKTEMSSIIPLTLMEVNGFGLDSNELGKMKRILQYNMYVLELRAYQLAGRQFSLGSPNDIKQVLYREIGLKQPKEKGTGKNVLLKLDHELPRIIIEWRKISNTLSRTVIPFQQGRSLETSRVHGNYSHFTCTGRVCMSEPSLQSIPKDFDIQMIPYTREAIAGILDSCKIKFGSKLAAIIQQIDNELRDKTISENNVSLISMRNVFIPCSQEFVILTADYSQLELRILAHLCGDEKLVQALNNDADVFTEIASQWRNIPIEKVTYSIRQDAKTIVYGVIYGMGAHALAQKMEVDVQEADKFVRQFMKTYPGIQMFKMKCENECEQNGYVETMTGRRRYLPLIRSRHVHEREKAKRQAINSRIQGSAADLVKCAMAQIHSFLASKYPKSADPVEWTKIAKARRTSFSLQSPASHNVTTQLEHLMFFPILNLHDELIFEVRKSILPEIAKRIKYEMETSLKLKVKIPVVIKTGNSWGNLETYEFQNIKET